MNLATLLNLLIRSSSVLVESLKFSIYSLMSSANNDSFSSFFPIRMPFISSCLIAVARTSNTILNKSGESRHSCLVPDVKGNAFNFYPLNVMLAVTLSYTVFSMLRYVL